MTYRAPLTNHHSDGTLCPADHKHISSGNPLHTDCPSRACTRTVCSCGWKKAVCSCGWKKEESGKGYVNECRKRHLPSHTQGQNAPSAVWPLIPYRSRRPSCPTT